MNNKTRIKVFSLNGNVAWLLSTLICLGVLIIFFVLSILLNDYGFISNYNFYLFIGLYDLLWFLGTWILLNQGTIR